MTLGELVGALDGEDGAGGADGVADGDAAAVDVDLLGVKAKVAGDREGLGGKGLVDLEEVDVGEVKVELLGKLLGGEVRAVAHEGGLVAGNGEVADADHRGATELLGLGTGHDDHGGCGVVQGGGVGGGDGAGAVRHEARLQAGEALGGHALAGVLVGVKDGDGTLAAVNLDGDDLVLVDALGDGLAGALLGLGGKGVLLLAGDVELLGHVLGGDAVVGVVERPGQDVDDAILELLVAHAGAPAGAGHVVGQLGEGLGATSDDDLGLAALDLHDAVGDGLQAASALAVDGVGAGLVGKAGLQADGAGDEAVLAPGAHLADDALVNDGGVDAGALDGLGDDDGAHVDGGQRLQAATELAHGGAGAGDDDDVLGLVLELAVAHVHSLF